MRYFFHAAEDAFVLRPWGGYMCYFIKKGITGTGDIIESAVIKLPCGLHHEKEAHDFDELLCVLSGEGHLLVEDPEGKEHDYELEKGDIIYLPKNVTHDTCNVSDTIPLVFFEMNYQVEKQSDRSIRCLIKKGEEETTEKDFGSIVQAINPRTAGNDTIKGDRIVLKPGCSYEFENAAGKECFVFVEEGEVSAANRAGEATDLAGYALAFFKGEEYCCIKNNSQKEANLFRMYTV